MSNSTTVSPRDLKTFIEAVEFAADTDDWVPSPRQWKRIRDMINNLDMEVARTIPVPAPQVSYVQQVPQYQAVPSQLDQPVQLPQVARPPSLPPASFSSRRTPDIDTSNGVYSSNFA